MPDAVDDLERLRPQAAALGKVSNPLRVPYQVALKEAALCAAFVENYWEPTKERPGLVRVSRRLPRATSGAIVAALRAVQSAHTSWLLIVDPQVVSFGERARYVLEELESGVEFLLDDGVQEPADEQLAKLKKFDADAGESSAALGQRLNNYAALTEELKERLVEEDTGFDVNLIAEARQLAAALLEKPAQPEAEPNKAADAKLLRDQLLVILMHHVGSVRQCARRVFRGHPEILQLVTSAYQRRQRAENRARQKQAMSAVAEAEV